VIIINRGKIASHDAAVTMSPSGPKVYAVRFKGDKDKIHKAFNQVQLFSSVAPISSYEPGTYDFEIKGGGNVDIREAIFGCAVKNNLPVLMMKPQELTLEEIFLRVTGGDSFEGRRK
jgi:ABC-2 type transport system ATP-binding protein